MLTSSLRRRIRAAGTVMAVLAASMATLVLPSATTIAAAAPGTTLTFGALGLPTSLQWSGPGAQASVSIPLPLNLQPSSMQGRLLLPPNLGAGYLQFSSGPVQLSTVVVPPPSPQRTSLIFETSILGAQEIAGYANIQITFVQTAAPVVCGNVVTLTADRLSVGFTGELATPTSISNFFPSVLHDVVIFTPPTLTPAVQQTVLNITAQTTARFSPMPFKVILRTWNPAQGVPRVPVVPFQRVLALVQTSGPGQLVLQSPTGAAPVLVLSGSATNLPLQADDLLGVPYNISQGRSATVQTVSTVPTVSNQELTFSQLGISSSFTGAGTQTLYLGIDGAAFNSLSSKYQAHLILGYTPVAAGDRGSVLAEVNGIILGSTTLNSSGSSTINVTIPGQFITRTTGLQLVVSFYPLGGVCHVGYRTMTLTVDPRSTVTATTYSGGLGGFSATSTALLPTFQVALDQASLTRLQVAAQVLTTLQQLTSHPLQPVVVPLSTAQGSGSPLLLVGASSALSTFGGPIASLGGTVVTVNAKRHVVVDPRVPLASLQVFAQSGNNRTVVEAATSGSWSLFNPIFNYLGSTSTVWQSLYGDVLATSPQGVVANLAVQAGIPGSNVFEVPQSNAEVGVALLASVIVALVVLGIGVLLILRHRRR